MSLNLRPNFNLKIQGDKKAWSDTYVMEGKKKNLKEITFSAMTEAHLTT